MSARSVKAAALGRWQALANSSTAPACAGSKSLHLRSTGSRGMLAQGQGGQLPQLQQPHALSAAGEQGQGCNSACHSWPACHACSHVRGDARMQAEQECLLWTRPRPPSGNALQRVKPGCVLRKPGGVLHKPGGVLRKPGAAPREGGSIRAGPQAIAATSPPALRGCQGS